jgi:hypothetical protein
MVLWYRCSILAGYRQYLFWAVVRGALDCSLVSMGLIIESIILYWYGSIVESVGCIIIIICKILS